jgi:hypothetical protein
MFYHIVEKICHRVLATFTMEASADLHARQMLEEGHWRGYLGCIFSEKELPEYSSYLANKSYSIQQHKVVVEVHSRTPDQEYDYTEVFPR